LRRHLALTDLVSHRTLSLTPDQRQELQKREKQAAKDVQEQIGHLYRLLHLPDRNGLAALDLGLPTYGGEHYLEERVYERLRSEGPPGGKNWPRWSSSSATWPIEIGWKPGNWPKAARAPRARCW
jgi:hypothetical protein